MEIEYHMDIETQKKMAEIMKTIEQRIEMEEKQIGFIQDLKKTMLDGMMVEARRKQ